MTGFSHFRMTGSPVAGKKKGAEAEAAAPVS